MRKMNCFWLFSLLSLMILGFVSCSDDDEGPGSSSDLVGTWELVEGYYVEKVNGKIVSEEHEDSSRGYRTVYTADGDYLSYINNYGSDSGTWSYKGGKIGITFDDEDDVYTEYVTVLELTATTLTIEYSDIEKFDGDTYEGYSKETFRKIADKK